MFLICSPSYLIYLAVRFSPMLKAIQNIQLCRFPKSVQKIARPSNIDTMYQYTIHYISSSRIAFYVILFLFASDKSIATRWLLLFSPYKSTKYPKRMRSELRVTAFKYRYRQLDTKHELRLKVTTDLHTPSKHVGLCLRMLGDRCHA